jgi:hypothetical protein
VKVEIIRSSSWFEVSVCREDSPEVMMPPELTMMMTQNISRKMAMSGTEQHSHTPNTHTYVDTRAQFLENFIVRTNN